MFICSIILPCCKVTRSTLHYCTIKYFTSLISFNYTGCNRRLRIETIYKEYIFVYLYSYYAKTGLKSTNKYPNNCLFGKFGFIARGIRLPDQINLNGENQHLYE